MELEDYVEKLQKQKKAEKKQRRKQEKDERVENRDQRKRLMKFTSSQKYRMTEVGKRHMWKVFKERRKNYYNYPRGVVYLSCIPHGFFEEQMASYFNQFGKVTGIYMPRAPSGKIRGYAFIEFQLEVIAKIVADTMNNYLFYQRILKAKYIPPDQQKPYMFVFPFGEKRKTAVRIAAEQKRRDVQLTEAAEEAYKQKVANQLEKVKNKMAALGTDYCVQVSGEAPTPSSVPPTSTNKEKKATKKKLKEIKTALSVKTDNPDQKDIASLLDEKLTRQIKKQISAKLSKPLQKKTAAKSKVQEKESDSDQDSESEADFETADEGSFFNDDFAIGDSDSDKEEFADFDSDDDDDDDMESPVKKMKVETSTSHQKKGDKSPAQKKGNANKSPGNTNAKSANKSPVTKKAQVGKSPAQKKEKIDKTPSKLTKAAEKSPTNQKAKLEESPVTKKAKADKTPKKAAGTKNEPSLVESAKKTPAKTPSKTTERIESTKKTPAAKTPSKTSESVVSKTPKSVGKEGKSKKSEKLRMTSPKKNEKVVTSPAEGLKRKSMSDVKMKKGLLNVEKKRKSLPK
uniref:MKI67 FHA domain-interacting nucleolar phosphoprotein-like n=1 Tax=Cacopsylla melanoneura TaxID=428564 RepID=A0A8D8VMT7_9HEMI